MVSSRILLPFTSRALASGIADLGTRNLCGTGPLVRILSTCLHLWQWEQSRGQYRIKCRREEGKSFLSTYSIGSLLRRSSDTPSRLYIVSPLVAASSYLFLPLK